MDKIECNYFGLNKDLLLCLVYVSPDTSTHQSSRDNIWNMLEDEIANFSKVSHIILTGDFNAQTSLLPDHVTHDSDLHILLPPDYLVDTVIPRKSE